MAIRLSRGLVEPCVKPSRKNQKHADFSGIGISVVDCDTARFSATNLDGAGVNPLIVLSCDANFARISRVVCNTRGRSLDGSMMYKSSCLQKNRLRNHANAVFYL